jgi:hypothetical protein
MTAPSEFTIYDELYVYAGSRGREPFILQNVVDAHHAQTATDETNGLEVQHAHIHLGRTRRQWPRVVLPQSRGDLTPEDVMRAAEGDERDAAISEWCRSVWKPYADDNRATIVDLLRHHA